MGLDIRMSEGLATLRLLAWLSPAFPTGAYAYSHGVEWAVECGDVRDAASLRGWVESILRHGAGRSDAILLAHAHRCHADPAALAGLVELALATAGCRERRAEAVGQGNAFVAAAGAWGADGLRDLADRVGDVPYCIAVGAMAGAYGIAVAAAVRGAVQGFAANLISAAVRLVPLGQSAGLSVLAGLEAVVLAVADEACAAGLDDLGGACVRGDLAAIRHETQYSRMFRS